MFIKAGMGEGGGAIAFWPVMSLILAVVLMNLSYIQWSLPIWLNSGYRFCVEVFLEEKICNSEILCVDLQSFRESRTIKKRGLCFYLPPDGGTSK